jgi:hypothetical protein
MAIFEFGALETAASLILSKTRLHSLVCESPFGLLPHFEAMQNNVIFDFTA